MPWSAKAQELLREQYAPTGAAGRASIRYAVAVLEGAAALLPEAGDLLHRYRERQELTSLYVNAYRRYCWPVNSIADFALHPFTYSRLPNVFTPMPIMSGIWRHFRVWPPHAGLLIATSFKRVDLSDESSVAEATSWWEELTGSGGEGMVLKPLGYVQRGRRDLVQPGLEVPWTRISTHHLWSGIHARRKSGAPPRA